MSARQHDNPLRWFVTSRSRPAVEHLVDLELYDGNGACPCEHFSFALEPMLKRGAPPSDEFRCHHIKEARARLADLLITAKRQEKKGKKR
jgi:hypothetical protein